MGIANILNKIHVNPIVTRSKYHEVVTEPKTAINGYGNDSCKKQP